MQSVNCFILPQHVKQSCLILTDWYARIALLLAERDLLDARKDLWTRKAVGEEPAKERAKRARLASVRHSQGFQKIIKKTSAIFIVSSTVR